MLRANHCVYNKQISKQRGMMQFRFCPLQTVIVRANLGKLETAEVRSYGCNFVYFHGNLLIDWKCACSLDAGNNLHLL